MFNGSTREQTNKTASSLCLYFWILPRFWTGIDFFFFIIINTITEVTSKVAMLFICPGCRILIFLIYVSTNFVSLVDGLSGGGQGHLTKVLPPPQLLLRNFTFSHTFLPAVH